MCTVLSELRSKASATEFAAEYRDVPEGHISTPDSLIREMCRWVLAGNFHQHEFRLVATATVQSWGIHHQNHIHHLIDGKRVDEPTGWGHDSVYAYKSSREREERGGYGCHGWHVGLLASRIFRHDLPCCGGSFVFEKEYTDYSTLVIGRCSKCCARWEITDGSLWQRRNR